jgi:predicted transcriptional regulator
MQSHFQDIFHHLSPQEQQIVLELSKFENPISREELRQSLNLSSVNFNNGLQSLQQRYLITKIKEDKILFKLSPVFQEYVRTCC